MFRVVDHVRIHSIRPRSVVVDFLDAETGRVLASRVFPHPLKRSLAAICQTAKPGAVIEIEGKPGAFVIPGGPKA